MPHIINGNEIASLIKNELREEVIKRKTQDPTWSASLVVIQVGDDPASSVYVRNKRLACTSLGILSVEYKLSEHTTEAEIMYLIQSLNDDVKVSGILVQLPLPKHINEQLIIETIHPTKDVDGFHPENVGKLWLGNTGYLSCTPAGVIQLLKRSNISLAGKHCVIIGRSNIVGKPMAALLLREDATVTICHSRTTDLQHITRQADILIVAMGIPRFITKEYVKEGAVVIDVGIHRIDQKLCGDVDYDDVAPITSAITPVPGGVGPMTIAMLMTNVLQAKRS